MSCQNTLSSLEETRDEITGTEMQDETAALLPEKEKESEEPVTEGEKEPESDKGPEGDLVGGKLKFTLIGGTRGDQDAAAWGGYLFKFNSKGWCYVYDLKNFSEKTGEIRKKTGEKTSFTNAFQLDRHAQFVPHSNSVTFGTEKYAPEDEFPLLYCNVYNNYAKEADQKRGMLCVYRITRNAENKFSSQLVQLIQVGFADSPTLWASANTADARPYGNFAIDRETNTLYAFTMRDEDKSTRVFSFTMPKLSEGEKDSELGVKKAVLQEKDILQKFSCDYFHYIQGAEFADGNLWSLEGRTNNVTHPAVLRIISPKEKKEIRYVHLPDYVADVEPEVITFWNGKCYYGDVKGNLYLVEEA